MTSAREAFSFTEHERATGEAPTPTPARDRAITGSGATPDEPLRRASFAGRMAEYIHEMYPVPARLLIATLLAASFLGLTARIHSVFVWTPQAFLVAIASTFLLMLILRLMDELKDCDIDRALFPERPVPSGRVLQGDIAFSLIVSTAAFLAVNAGSNATLVSAVIVLAYAFLMFRHFFAPRLLRRSLPITLATHNPIIALLLLHLVVCLAVTLPGQLAAVRWGPTLLLVAMYWSVLLAWEIARKVRAVSEEDDYVTYSQLLGRRRSALLALLLQTVTLALGLNFGQTLELAWPFELILVAGYLVTATAHARFIRRRDVASSRLAPAVERFLLFTCVAGITGAAIS